VEQDDAWTAYDPKPIFRKSIAAEGFAGEYPIRLTGVFRVHWTAISAELISADVAGLVHESILGKSNKECSISSSLCCQRFALAKRLRNDRP
jgi:hypothetical protein